MARQYHGKRIFHLESPQARAEREEQRFRRRHDRLHRLHMRHPDDHRSYAPDAADNDLPDADVLDDCFEDDEL